MSRFSSYLRSAVMQKCLLPAFRLIERRPVLAVRLRKLARLIRLEAVVRRLHRRSLRSEQDAFCVPYPEGTLPFRVKQIQHRLKTALEAGDAHRT